MFLPSEPLIKRATVLVCFPIVAAFHYYWTASDWFGMTPEQRKRKRDQAKVPGRNGAPNGFQFHAWHFILFLVAGYVFGFITGVIRLWTL